MREGGNKGSAVPDPRTFNRTAALVPAYATGSSSIMPAAVLEIGMW
jgi:hypothetical protein